MPAEFAKIPIRPLDQARRCIGIGLLAWRLSTTLRRTPVCGASIGKTGYSEHDVP